MHRPTWSLTRAALAALIFATALLTAGPAWAQGTGSTGLSGYMDLHYNKAEFQDGVLDFHRFVLLVTHRFCDRIRFVSELELEHAVVEGLEEAGELELEQAYLDFLMSRAFNVRAGMLLAPVGIINERHEPPVFYGVERPLVDTVIIPTTWFDAGAGVHGEVGPRLALSRLRDGAAQRRRVQRRGGHSRRPAEGQPKPTPAGWP